MKMMSYLTALFSIATINLPICFSIRVVFSRAWLATRFMSPLFVHSMIIPKMTCLILLPYTRLKATASKASMCISYGFAGLELISLIQSCFADDPVQRANKRGYTLK